MGLAFELHAIMKESSLNLGVGMFSLHVMMGVSSPKME